MAMTGWQVMAELDADIPFVEVETEDDGQGESTCTHCDMETSQVNLTAGECLAEHRRG